MGSVPGSGRALRQGMAAHSSAQAGVMAEEPGGYRPQGHKESDTLRRLHTEAHKAALSADQSF